MMVGCEASSRNHSYYSLDNLNLLLCFCWMHVKYISSAVVPNKPKKQTIHNKIKAKMNNSGLVESKIIGVDDATLDAFLEMK